MKHLLSNNLFAPKAVNFISAFGNEVAVLAGCAKLYFMSSWLKLTGLQGDAVLMIGRFSKVIKVPFKNASKRKALSLDNTIE